MNFKRQKIRVVVAEDDVLIRRAICMLVGSFDGIEIVGETGDGREAVELAEKLKPDIVLMDLIMPVMDGTVAAGEIKLRCPKVKIIALTAHEQVVKKAISAGVDGIVLKNATPEELNTAIKTTFKGGFHICPDVSARLEYEKGLCDGITSREKEILNLLMAGHRAKEISHLLGISSRTVEKHRDSIRKKYGVDTMAELVAVYSKGK